MSDQEHARPSIPLGRGPQLLVSVRNATEAAAAVLGGADILDVKEPANGPLGRADPTVWREIHGQFRDTHPVTAAAGELQHWLINPAAPTWLFDLNRQATLTKFGTSGLNVVPNWRRRFESIRQRLPYPRRLVLVCYVDRPSESPCFEDLLDATRRLAAPVMMLDTFNKLGPGTLDVLDVSSLRAKIARAASHGISLAVAGRITTRQMSDVLAAGATVVGVRGAACRRGQRESSVSPRKVRRVCDAMSCNRSAVSTR